MFYSLTVHHLRIRAFGIVDFDGTGTIDLLDNVRTFDTSILHHAFISIFIALWAVITHYISILMAILSYFTRFIMKREYADSWNSGWKRSKPWKPILHNSKRPETPRNNFLDLIKKIGQKK